MIKEQIEQKAKEYRNSLKQRLIDEDDFERLGMFDENVEEAYTAGFHECEREHDWNEIESKISPKREISKKYMPKNEEKVLLKYHFYGDDEIHISDGYYDAYDFQFHIANNPKFKIVCVIAWKEIKK